MFRLLIVVFGRDHLVKMFMDLSADISPPLSIGYERKIKIPSSPAEGDSSEYDARGKIERMGTNILSITGVSLLEYIADRLSIRSKAVSADDTIIIGVEITRRNITSPVCDGHIRDQIYMKLTTSVTVNFRPVRVHSPRMLLSKIK